MAATGSAANMSAEEQAAWTQEQLAAANTVPLDGAMGDQGFTNVAPHVTTAQHTGFPGGVALAGFSGFANAAPPGMTAQQSGFPVGLSLLGILEKLVLRQAAAPEEQELRLSRCSR